jgi:hypothetical protein
MGSSTKFNRNNDVGIHFSINWGPSPPMVLLLRPLWQWPPLPKMWLLRRLRPNRAQLFSKSSVARVAKSGLKTPILCNVLQ